LNFTTWVVEMLTTAGDTSLTSAGMSNGKHPDARAGFRRDRRRGNAAGWETAAFPFPAHDGVRQGDRSSAPERMNPYGDRSQQQYDDLALCEH
jgi:hypothetical protein